MRAGRLRKRVEIWQERWVMHPVAGQQKETVLVSSVWAERVDQGGQEFMNLGVELNEHRAVFRVRYLSTYATDMQVKSDSQTFDIIAINEIGNRQGQELLCRAVS